MNKKGLKANQALTALVIVAIVAIAAVMWAGGIGPFATAGVGGGSGSGGGTATTAALCPDDGSTTLTFTVRNGLNETGRETYDNTALVYQVTESGESLAATMTNTTAGTQDLPCGSDYRLRLTSTDSDGGDSAKLLAIDADTSGSAQIIENGKAIQFSATGSSVNLEAAAKQHGVLEFRGFDNDNNAFLYDDGDASATDYETTGATFTSTTDNTTATAVGAGGQVSMSFDVRTTETADDVDFSDFGAYVLVDAATSTWDDPVVKFDGASLSEVTLDTYESRLWSGTYEFAYKIDDESSLGSATIGRDAQTLDFDIRALSGVNPGASDDVVVAFAGIGAARETAGNSVRYAGATDASSPAAIYTVQSFTVDVS